MSRVTFFFRGCNQTWSLAKELVSLQRKFLRVHQGITIVTSVGLDGHSGGSATAEGDKSDEGE